MQSRAKDAAFRGDGEPPHPAVGGWRKGDEPGGALAQLLEDELGKQDVGVGRELERRAVDCQARPPGAKPLVNDVVEQSHPDHL
jgi:hypothetical protein